MRTQRLGATDLDLTVLGFGAWAIGGAGWTLGWGPQDERDSVAAVERALEAGMNWIDTAPIYGRGRSEAVIGKAIAGLAAKPIIATKCGRFDDDDGNLLGDLSRDTILRELDESLARLGVDRIDLYQVHFPEPDAQLEEAWATLAGLKAEGVVRAIGASNFTIEQLRRALAIAPVDALQPPYSLVDRGVEDGLLQFCAAHGIGVVVFSPQGGGLLTGALTRARLASLPKDDWRVAFEVPRFHEPELSRNLALVELLREIGGRHGSTPGDVAIAWTLRRPEVTSAIVGLRSAAQVDGVVGAADLLLADGELAEIEALLARDPVEFVSA